MHFSAYSGCGLGGYTVVHWKKITKFQIAKILWRQDKGEAAIYLATLGSLVVVDLFTGIAVGIMLALAKLLYSFSHLDIEVREDNESGETVIHSRGQPALCVFPH